jgi:hypothetical protein
VEAMADPEAEADVELAAWSTFKHRRSSISWNLQLN